MHALMQWLRSSVMSLDECWIRGVVCGVEAPWMAAYKSRYMCCKTQ